MEYRSFDDEKRNTELLEQIVAKLDEQNGLIVIFIKAICYISLAFFLMFLLYTNYLHPRWMWLGFWQTGST